MSAPVVNPSYYADFSGLESLRSAAKKNDGSAVRAAAQQFESLFTKMMLQSMRDASLGDGMGESDTTRFYQDMFDQQLSVQMSRGKGLGLADMLVQQLTRAGLAGPAASAVPQRAGPAVAPAGAALAAPSALAPSVPAAGPPQSALPLAPLGVAPATSAPGVDGPVLPALPLAAAPADEPSIQFIQQIAAAAERAAGRLGVAPEAVIAQAALETGWGQHVPTGADGTSSGNLFGIKAAEGWLGPSVTAQTTEYQQGVPKRVSQPFRAYASPEDSVSDYAALLQGNPRYAQALGTGADIGAFARGLKAGGYATDPAYASKLEAVAGVVRRLRTALGLKSHSALPTTLGRSTG